MRPAPFPALLLVLGGLSMAALWIVFTISHGATSFNEGRRILGWDMHVWGLLLGVIPNALVAAGLAGLRDSLLAGSGRVGRIGYVALLGGLLGSAALDLAFRALAPPLLLPIVALGLLAVGVSRGATPMPARPVLALMGAVLLVASAMAYLPIEVIDAYGMYRIYGALAHLVPGLGWTIVGLSGLAAPRRIA